jgi:hypothetical protein
LAAFELLTLDEAWTCPTDDFATVAHKKTVKVIDNIKSNIKATATSISKSLVTGLVYDDMFKRIYVSLRSGHILQILRDPSTVNTTDSFTPTSEPSLTVSFMLMVGSLRYFTLLFH